MSCATVSLYDMLARSGGQGDRRRRRTICIPHKRSLSGSGSLHRDMGYAAPEFAAACHGLLPALVIALLRCYAVHMHFDKYGLKTEPTPIDSPQALSATSSAICCTTTGIQEAPDEHPIRARHTTMTAGLTRMHKTYRNSGFGVAFSNHG